jgi:predicted GIY-YIG superfamily endonuclease
MNAKGSRHASLRARSAAEREAIQASAGGPGLLRRLRRLAMTRLAATPPNDEVNLSLACSGEGVMKQPAVYIVANRRNGTLYTGVTSNLVQRVYQHRNGLVPGFTSRYGCKMLVWYELHEDMISAITREKQIKAGSRRKKLALIEAMNPTWRDLYEDIV